MKMRFFKAYRSGNNTNFGLRNIFAAVLKASKICNIKSSCIFSALFISVVALSSNALYSNDLYLLEAADSAQADPFLASANPDGGCKYKIVSKIDFDKEIFSELSAILGKPAAADAGSPFAFLGPVVDFYYTDSKLNRSMLLSIALTHIDKDMLYCQFSDFKNSGREIIQKSGAAKKSLVLKDPRLFAFLAGKYGLLFSNGKFNAAFLSDGGSAPVKINLAKYVFTPGVDFMQGKPIQRALFVSFSCGNMDPKVFGKGYESAADKDECANLLKKLAKQAGLQTADFGSLDIFTRPGEIPNTQKLIYLDKENKCGYALEVMYK